MANGSEIGEAGEFQLPVEPGKKRGGAGVCPPKVPKALPLNPGPACAKSIVPLEVHWLPELVVAAAHPDGPGAKVEFELT